MNIHSAGPRRQFEPGSAAERRLPAELVNLARLQDSITSRSVYALFKRVLDVAVVLTASPAVLLITGASALLILMYMGRPIFFVQSRVGRSGHVFKMLKLRTMRVAAVSTSTATAKNDPRITSLGKFLRLSHLDELPQLWNILLGHMTLIGPRPEQPELVARYAELIPNYELRHLVTPGLSGWAQVHFGYAADVDETRVKLEHDLFYIQHFGPGMDLSILVRTILVYSNPVYVR